MKRHVGIHIGCGGRCAGDLLAAAEAQRASHAVGRGAQGDHVGGDASRARQAERTHRARP